MNRHSVICRLGVDDSVNVTPLQADSVVTAINFVDPNHRLSFGLGQALDQLHRLALQPSERAVDLAVIAALIFAADTRIVRAADGQDGWTREIDLYLPVSEPDLWQTARPRLEQMLRFLTGDRWRFIFRPRIPRHRSFTRAPDELQFSAYTCISLFSGGLDSFIGALDLLADGAKPLLVSHYWDGITSAAQQYCLDLLAKRFPSRAPSSLRVRTGFSANQIDGVEATQRARSFLFFALAALPASAFPDGIEIIVPENGLIALNVPLDVLRLGALSTRTTHPFYLASWNALLAELGLRTQLVNPYRFRTKGEMARGSRDAKFLKKHAASTMSCSSPAKARWSGTPSMHCGFCVPCLIRRASLVAAFKSDDTQYTIKDLAAAGLDSSKANGEHVRSFQVALARLKTKPKLAKFWIHKPGPLSPDPDELKEYEGVYRRGMAEVADILKSVTAKPR